MFELLMGALALAAIIGSVVVGVSIAIYHEFRKD